jgi:hypothetical protein
MMEVEGKRGRPHADEWGEEQLVGAGHLEPMENFSIPISRIAPDPEQPALRYQTCELGVLFRSGTFVDLPLEACSLEGWVIVVGALIRWKH